MSPLRLCVFASLRFWTGGRDLRYLRYLRDLWAVFGWVGAPRLRASATLRFLPLTGGFRSSVAAGPEGPAYTIFVTSRGWAGGHSEFRIPNSEFP